MSEKIRNHENYFGMRAATFTVLGHVELSASRLNFCFDTWAAVEDFEAGADPITRLRREFAVQSAELNDLKAANETVFQGIETACLAIAGVQSGGWELEYLSISTTDKVMVIIVRNVPVADDRRTVTKTRDTYDRTVAENLTLIGQVIGLTVGYGKEHDDFLAQSQMGEQ